MDKETKENGNLVNSRVLYSVTKGQLSEALVLDKISMKEKRDDTCTITGYLIRDLNTDQVLSISYWRIHSIIE